MILEKYADKSLFFILIYVDKMTIYRLINFLLFQINPFHCNLFIINIEI